MGNNLDPLQEREFYSSVISIKINSGEGRKKYKGKKRKRKTPPVFVLKKRNFLNFK
jgi:hypothetical protein